MNKKAKVAVLVSGGGTNLQAILDAQKTGIIKSGEVVLVISNKTGAYAPILFATTRKTRYSSI